MERENTEDVFNMLLPVGADSLGASTRCVARKDPNHCTRCLIEVPKDLAPKSLR